MFHFRGLGTQCRHDGTFHMDRRMGIDGYLLMYFRTRTRITIAEEQMTAQPGTVILYNINTPHSFAAAEDEYLDDWALMDGSEDDIRPFLPLLDRPIAVGECIRLGHYFALMCDIYYGGRGDRACSLILRALLEELLTLTARTDAPTAYFPALTRLRMEIYRRPDQDWSVRRMAETLALSEAYLQDLYHRTFGISCIADVITSRIETAKTLLADPTLSVTEIALRCGYNSAIHFSRQFRQRTGLSPSQYRKA